ncbi:MAG: serine/threonine protein kinase, partial [Candidatus Obscuribacterales bacterium]|nr:serine/threonine protein kinase [Candidatus Obscuribacterales bacterium]
MTESNICPICKNLKKVGGSGSLTQWIVACNCDLQDSKEAQELSISMCRACGKRIGSGRSGSFTQFIFRWDICQCQTPKPYKVDFENNLSLEAEAYELAESEIDEEEIYFEPGLFPKKRYRPIKQLGRGGGGSVYLARDMLLNKLVAVKLLHVLEARQLIAFQDEARSTSKLTHPCIVSVLDFGVTDASVPYMVLEYVPGLSLEEILKREGRLGWRRCQIVFERVCNGLSYAHEHGIFHRDITPGNVLIVESAEPDVKVIDFGIASVTNMEFDETGAQGRTVAGTPLYMSPDQGLGRSYDARSEVYSLGCVLFEALSGRPPFSGGTALETLHLHAEGSVPVLSNFASESLPPGFDDVVAKALSKNPDDRFATVGQFKTALLEIEAIEVKQLGAGVSLPAYRQPPVLLFVSAALAAIAIFVFVQVSINDKQQGLTQLKKEKERLAKERIAKQKMDARREAAMLENVSEEEVFKELNWTGGNWKENREGPYGPLEMEGHMVSDEDFKELLKHPDLRAVKVTMESTVTGKGLSYIKGLSLRRFWSMSTRFNDEGAASLTEFPGLTSVKIQSASQLTRAGFESFSRIQSLQFLQLRMIFNLPKGAMEAISRNRSITTLALDHSSPFFNQDLEQISRLPKLKSLRLNGISNVDDSFVPA